MNGFVSLGSLCEVTIMFSLGEDQDSSFNYNSLYPDLVTDVRSTLAFAIGADVSPEGCLKLDTHQSTSIEGLYAAGDLVFGLDQISGAVGPASTADGVYDVGSLPDVGWGGEVIGRAHTFGVNLPPFKKV